MNTVLHQQTLTAENFYRVKSVLKQVCPLVFIHENQDTLVYAFRFLSAPVVQWEIYVKPNQEYKLCLIEETRP